MGDDQDMGKKEGGGKEKDKGEKEREREENTKYVHIKSTTVYAPRRNWDSPNPFLASECSPPPRNRGEGAHYPSGGGWGGVPIPTKGIHYGTLYMYVLCGEGQGGEGGGKTRRTRGRKRGKRRRKW